MSASIMGREYGGEERMEDTVDFPVAIEPVRPRRSMMGCEGRVPGERRNEEMKMMVG